MKLISYQHAGRESWGAVVEGQVVDLASPSGIATLAEFVGSPQFAERDALLARAGAPVAAFDAVQLLPVIPKPEKIVCAVRNYMDHHQEVLAAGMQRELSEEPPIFLRVWRSQTPHNGPIVLPRVSETLDWEGELAVIIGQGGRDIPESEAFKHVAGYACYNDGSVRDWQRHTSQWVPGKNFWRTGGFGPWMVTSDEIPFGTSMTLVTRLNGQEMQRATTEMLIHSIAKQIAYVSAIAPLQPGDVIVTGTPGGVGARRQPPVWMKAGDVVEIEVDRVGVLRNPIVDEA